MNSSCLGLPSLHSLSPRLSGGALLSLVAPHCAINHRGPQAESLVIVSPHLSSLFQRSCAIWCPMSETTVTGRLGSNYCCGQKWKPSTTDSREWSGTQSKYLLTEKTVHKRISRGSQWKLLVRKMIFDVWQILVQMLDLHCNGLGGNYLLLILTP